MPPFPPLTRAWIYERSSALAEPVARVRYLRSVIVTVTDAIRPALVLLGGVEPSIAGLRDQQPRH